MLTYLPGLGLAVAQLVGKMLTVPPEDTVRQLHAHQRTGFLNNDTKWTRFILFVQAVVDYPSIGSDHVPQFLLFHQGLLG